MEEQIYNLVSRKLFKAGLDDSERELCLVDLEPLFLAGMRDIFNMIKNNSNSSGDDLKTRGKLLANYQGKVTKLKSVFRALFDARCADGKLSIENRANDIYLERVLGCIVERELYLMFGG